MSFSQQHVERPESVQRFRLRRRVAVVSRDDVDGESHSELPSAESSDNDKTYELPDDYIIIHHFAVRFPPDGFKWRP